MKRKTTFLFSLVIAMLMTINVTGVRGQLTPTFSNLEDSYCPYGSDIGLYATPKGGYFKIDGIADDTLRLSQLDLGVHTVKYIVDTIAYTYEKKSGTELFPFIGYSLSLSDDRTSSLLDLGFDFNFFGNVYNQVSIASNGYLTFTYTGSGSTYNPQKLPNSNTPNNIIAFAWTDLNPYSGGEITYYTYGSEPNRVFVVTFDSVAHYYGGGYPNTVQVQLNESDSTIEIHSVSLPAVPDYYRTMGIENADGSIAYTVDGRNQGYQWSTSDETVIFTPVLLKDSVTKEITIAYVDEPLTFSQNTLTFDDAYVGVSASEYVYLKNIGCSTLDIDSIKHDNTDFDYYINTSEIRVDDSATLTIYYNATTTAESVDTFYVYTAEVDTFIVVNGSAVHGSEIGTSVTSFKDTVTACETTFENSFYIINNGEGELEYTIPSAIPISDDFEDGELSGWATNTSDMAIDIVSYDDEQGGVLEVSGGLSDDEDAVFKTFADINPTNIKVKIRPDFSANYTGYFIIGEDDETIYGGSIYAYFYSSSYGYVNGSSFNIDGEDTWYTLEFKNIDYTNYTFDFYLNEEKVLSNVSFYYTANSFNNIHLLNYYSATTYYDDIVVGTESEWYTVSPSGGTISSDDSTQITISYNTSGLSSGNNKGYLCISSNDPSNSVSRVELDVFVDVDSVPTLSVTSVDFGSQFVNATVIDTVLISSDNCSNIIIDSIVIDNDVFEVLGDDIEEIEANSSENLYIQYNPDSIKTESGSAIIYSGGTAYTISLAGEGIDAPVLTLSDNVLYDTLLSCDGSVSGSFIIGNTGGNDLEYTVDGVTKDTLTSAIRYYSYGATTTHTFTPESGISDLQVAVTVNGDYTESSETASVYAEGTYLGTLSYGNDNIDISDTFTISSDLLNTLLSDGVVIISVVNTSDVDYGYTYDLHTVSLLCSIDFEFSTEGSVVENGLSTVNYDIDLSSENSGTIRRSFLVTTNDPLNETVAIPLYIYKDGEPVFEGPESCVDFGVVEIGETSIREFEITNSGCDTLFITSVEASADFYAAAEEFVLPGMTSLVSVEISPSEDSIYADTLTLVTNAGMFDICLTGSSSSDVAANVVSVDTMEIDIECANFNTESFTITNSATVDLNFSISVPSELEEIIELSDYYGLLSKDESLDIEIAAGQEDLMPGTYSGDLYVVNTDKGTVVDTINVIIVDEYFYVEQLVVDCDDPVVCNGDTATISANDGFFFTYLWSTGAVEQSIDVTETNTYSVEVVDYNGCEFDESTDVIVLNPVVDLGDDLSIFDNETTTLDAGSFASYAWTTSDSSQTIVVDGSSTGTGIFEYGVTVLDTFGCSASDDILVTVEEHVSGVSDQTLSKALTLYPNPATEYVSINMGSAAENVRITITTIDNREISVSQIGSVLSDSHISLDLSGYTPGVYFILIDADGQRISKKLIVE